MPTVHRAYWELHNNPEVFAYDPADDGPETFVIRAQVLTDPDAFASVFPSTNPYRRVCP